MHFIVVIIFSRRFLNEYFFRTLHCIIYSYLYHSICLIYDLQYIMITFGFRDTLNIIFLVRIIVRLNYTCKQLLTQPPTNNILPISYIFLLLKNIYQLLLLFCFYSMNYNSYRYTICSKYLNSPLNSTYKIVLGPKIHCE